MSKFGSAAIVWTDTNVGTERILLLDAPLRDLRPGYSRTAYTAESLDKTAIYSVTVGTGAHELVGNIRYEDDPQGLLDLIQAGATNTTLTYLPNLADPDFSYTVKLIAPRDVNTLTVDLDNQRSTFGEMQVEVRFRKTDQSAFTETYDGVAVMWAFRAGQAIKATEFSRAGTAYYASKGYGTLTSSAAGARIHYTDVNADGSRETPGLLLEGAFTNLIVQSANFGVTWATTGPPTLTSGQTDPINTSTAYLIADTDGVVQQYISIVPTFTTNAVSKAVSLFVRQGTVLAASGSDIQLRDTTAPADRLLANITWSAGVPTVTMTTGTKVFQERWRGGWWRLGFRTTAVTVANTNELRIVPASTAAQTGNIYAFGVQGENNLFPTSYISTAGGTVARVRDLYEVPVSFRVQTLSFYVRYISTGNEGQDAAIRAVAAIGTGGSTDTTLYFRQSASATTWFLVLGTNSVNALSGTVSNTTVAYGTPVELLANVTITAATRTGTCQLSVSINNGTVTTSTVSASTAVSDFFENNKMALHDLPTGAALGWNAIYTHAGVIRGAVDMVAARRMLRVS